MTSTGSRGSVGSDWRRFARSLPLSERQPMWNHTSHGCGSSSTRPSGCRIRRPHRLEVWPGGNGSARISSMSDRPGGWPRTFPPATLDGAGVVDLFASVADPEHGGSARAKVPRPARTTERDRLGWRGLNGSPTILHSAIPARRPGRTLPPRPMAGLDPVCQSGRQAPMPPERLEDVLTKHERLGGLRHGRGVRGAPFKRGQGRSVAVD
jgi:hypothetical protein